MNWMTVKVLQESHHKGKQLLEVIARHGWAAVGSDRSDPVTMGAVIDEALTRLLAQTSEPKP
jgi:hypothetical protein